MSEPYVQKAESAALKIRWISVQCYEIILPNGKVILTDPFYLDKSYYEGRELSQYEESEKLAYSSEGFSVDDITGADYIILNHVHCDHCNILGEVWEKFRGRVLVHGACALEIAKTFQIPTQAIYPMYPGNTYYFDDFTLKTYPGAHDTRGFREGRFFRPDDEIKYYNLMGMPNVPNTLMALGGIFNLNFMITTNENFKIDFFAGKDYEGHLQHMKDERPNMLLCHRIRTFTPEYYANALEQMGAQFVLPLHHNNAKVSGEDLNLYFQKVNEALIANGSAARAFNPEPYKWFKVYMGIVRED